MKNVIVALCRCLSGCGAMQEEMRRSERAHEADIERKAAVLHTGASEGEVMGAWGSPSEIRSFGGSVNGSTLQFGRCAYHPSVSNGILFVTFVNGKLLSWSTARC